ncbi:MAG: hypothetical protein DRQ47_05145, partial [Gammaproteobacteria bacterium]
MTLINQLLGPKSKYEKQLPYTYEAKVKIIEGEDDYNSYVADTICGLISNLENKSIAPDMVTVYEVFNDQEKRLDINLCLSGENHWLN